MAKKLTRAWLTPNAKNRFKARASIQGLSLSDYLDNLSKEAQKEDKKNNNKYGGFF